MTKEIDVDALISLRERLRQAETIAFIAGTSRNIDMMGRDTLLAVSDMLHQTRDLIADLLADEPAAVRP